MNQLQMHLGVFVTVWDRVTKFSRYVGILKTKLLQLEAPKTYTPSTPQPQPAEFSELPSHQDNPSPMHES